MPTRKPSEQLSDVRLFARLLTERTANYQRHVEELVARTELELAETTASYASPADSDEARYLLHSHAERVTADAESARDLCASARQQHAAACQLLAELEGESGAGARAIMVLVVDDYGDVRELVADVLRSAGFAVRTAANGLEGLIAAFEVRPDIIVMDVAMPVLDGLEATRLIKANQATRDARVIAYTGTPSVDTAAFRSLFAAVLQKPAAPDDVLATVQHVATLLAQAAEKGPYS